MPCGWFYRIEQCCGFVFLGKHYYVTFALCYSAIRLSSVTLVQPTPRIEVFDNAFAPSNSFGTRAG